MAKILHSDAAPAEPVHYSFSAGSFDLGGSKKSYETDDAGLLAAAETHPWLTVEYGKDVLLQGAYVDQLRPEDDALSAVNSIANDPEAVKKEMAARVEEAADPVALDADETQTTVVTTGKVAETLAADDTSKTSSKVKD